MIGRVLGDRYELLERVGGGGMAFVYRARDLLLNRIVAVKILSPHYTNDEEFVRKFRREAQAAAGLSSPSIVGVYDVGQDDEVYYIVMEFLQGKTLKQVLNENGPLPVSAVLQIGRQIADALRTAHKHGVIHRDIKPHNIMLTADGHVKVTDFGIARAATSSTLTESGAMIGSVHYISPEQARGGFVSERSDIYSLGVVLYELLAGKVPFEGDSMFAIALKHLQETPTPLREIDPSIPLAVEQIVQKAMSKDQAGRYQTAEEMLQDLQKLLQEDGKKNSLQELVGSLDEPAAEPAPNNDDDLTKTYIPAPSGAVAEADKIGSKTPVRQRSWKRYAAILAAMLVLAGALFMAWIFWPGAVVVVPEVVGLSLTEAQRDLKDHNLAFTVVSEQYSDDEPNVVLSQDPLPGRSVRPGRMIALTISKGPEYADVPDVTTLPLRKARIQLENAGFTVADPINYVFSDAPPDTVTGQNPTGNTRLKTSTPIMLTVSKGPAPKPFAMPSLRGLSPDKAQQRLSELNLSLGQVSGPTTDAVVIEQSPAAGEQVTPGQSVDFKYGPQEVTAIVGWTVPADSETNNHQIEIYREDIHGVSLEFSVRLKRGETIQRNLKGVGFLRVIIKDDGQVVKEEVYP